MTTPPPSPQRTKLIGWKVIFILIVLLNYSAMIFVFHSSTSASLGEQLSHLPPPPPLKKSFDTIDENKQRSHNNNDGNKIHNNHLSTTPPQQPQILLAGMAFSDNTISDFALSFLISAACTYNIHSHILLAKRDENTPLTKKIEVLAAHSQPLPVDGRQGRPKCRKYIHVEVVPSEDDLLNMTKSYHLKQHTMSEKSMLLEEGTPNNPWNEHNRIARIKRSREYQRQLVIQMLTNNNDDNNHRYNNNNKEDDWNKVDWTTSQNAVIGVLDLDLFDYPSPQELIDVTREYISQDDNNSNSHNTNNNSHNTNNVQTSTNNAQSSNSKKYHAICSNGLFVMKSRSYNGYRRRYYDTFSTILLPNSWLHVDREKERGSLEGEDVELAKMNQDETLQWILKEGRRPTLSVEDSDNNNNHGGEEGVQYQYQPVPVRSCFNGLTLYRADIWLEPKCRYDTYHKDDDAYLSKRYQHACEHIVFHECLRRVLLEKEGGGSGSSGEGFSIAVQPDMTTLWHHLS